MARKMKEIMNLNNALANVKLSKPVIEKMETKGQQAMIAKAPMVTVLGFQGRPNRIYSNPQIRRIIIITGNYDTGYHQRKVKNTRKKETARFQSRLLSLTKLVPCLCPTSRLQINRKRSIQNAQVPALARDISKSKAFRGLKEMKLHLRYQLHEQIHNGH